MKKEVGRLAACLLAMAMLGASAGARSELRLPESLQAIGEEAFCGNTFIYQVTMSDSLTGIELSESLLNIGSGVFMDCEYLNVISIPERCTEIGEGAFEGCATMKKIVIPEGVTVIKASAFAGCSRLEEVVLPESLIRIEGYAFADCVRLKKINLPENIEYIETGALAGCPKVIAHVEPGSYAEDWCEREKVMTDFIPTGDDELPFV